MYVGVAVAEAAGLVGVAILVAVGEGMEVAPVSDEGVAAMGREVTGSTVPLETWPLSR